MGLWHGQGRDPVRESLAACPGPAGVYRPSPGTVAAVPATAGRWVVIRLPVRGPACDLWKRSVAKCSEARCACPLVPGGRTAGPPCVSPAPFRHLCRELSLGSTSCSLSVFLLHMLTCTGTQCTCVTCLTHRSHIHLTRRRLTHPDVLPALPPSHACVRACVDSLCASDAQLPALCRVTCVGLGHNVPPSPPGSRGLSGPGEAGRPLRSGHVFFSVVRTRA